MHLKSAWLLLLLLLAACAPLPERQEAPLPFAKASPWDALLLEEDGRWFLIASLHGDNALGLWDLEQNKEIGRYEEAGYHPDGLCRWEGERLVLAAEGERQVQLWRLQGGRLVLEKALPAPFAVRDCLAVDLDGDGHKDLVLTPYAGAQVVIWWGAGNFAFPQSQALAAAPTPWHAAVIDWNGDELPDLIWSDWDTGSIRVQLNLGRRRFATRFLQPVSPGSPRQVAAGDIDGDGREDAVAALETGKAARVFYHRGQNVETEDIPAPEWGYSSAAVLKDGTVALGEEGRVILARKGPSGWSLRQLKAGSLPSRLRVGDWNGDGKEDLLVVNSAGPGVNVYFGPLWEKAKALEEKR
ncbi:hypothetical protein JCM13664_13050 [Methylothermus subterraneus]